MSLENSGTRGGRVVDVGGKVVAVSGKFSTSEDVEFSDVSVVMSEPIPTAVVDDEVVVTVVAVAAASVNRMTSITTPWLGGRCAGSRTPEVLTEVT